MTDLKNDWLHAIGSAAAAVDAATAARALPADEGRAHRNRLAAERTWIETVDWAALESIRPATVAVLDLPAATLEPVVTKQAA